MYYGFLCFLIHVVNYDLLGKGGEGTTIVDIIWINGKRGEVRFFLFLGLGAVTNGAKCGN